MLFKICFLALVFNNLASSEYSGLLSRLYKKAAHENRPLILVLDPSLKDLEETPRAVKQKEVNVEIDRNVPLNLLELLNPKHNSLNHEHKHLSYDGARTEQHEVGPHYKHSDLEHLKNRLERERQRRDRKERRERNRAQVADDEDQIVNILQDEETNQEAKRDRLQKILQNRNDRDQDKYQNRNQDEYQNRNQDKYQNRNQDRYQYRNQDWNPDRNQDRNQDKNDEKPKSNNEKRALRTSVIKNLLRTFNDLNCEAKEECENECSTNDNKKKQSNCEAKCEVKYDCEESEEGGACGESDECGSEETGSTKGERLVTVTEK